MQAVRRIIDRIKRTHVYGAWKRYGDHNGDLLAAGVAYFAFFSIFPALALAFTIFGIVLRGHPEMLTTIANSLNATLPGMVKTPTNPNGIISLSAPKASTLTITGIVGFVTLLLSGLGWISALRSGIRGIYGLGASPGNFVTAKLRDLAVLFTLGLGVAASAILTNAIGGIAKHIAGWVGLDSQSWVITVVGLVLSAVFDALLMVVLLRMLSGVPLPWADVRNGAIVGGVTLTAMKYLSGFLIARATSNPLLGAVAVAVGLLFWLNLMSRVVLLSAAWSANDSDLARIRREEAAGEQPAGAVPVVAAHDGSTGRSQDGDSARLSTASPQAGRSFRPVVPAAPSRGQDRVSLALGALVGAAGALIWSARRSGRFTVE
ncbi:ribonuclease BN [Intrasporangium chromatireducens Q5-1]|uniref:Ribonuclease BN n=1 Tax=Intrasporangium chromatireducens Q5-1 TaxID=584657 RepID=W9GJQ8_9MICO|nr:YihY/virulence factor BrkB family protein [Intrasporangium chromatireducens]EWT05392.1 ribonuclease BN [Intrasporangium chromatireducens Q5-1]